MRRYLTFVAVGSLFATVEEFLTVAVLRHDVASYVFTVLILFPVFLSAVWISSRWIDRLAPREATREVVHFLVFGFVGLLMEWFLMGLAPWSNPDAPAAVMGVFQLGMFSFWATVAFVPRLWINSDRVHRDTVRAILRFYVPYFALVYLAAAVTPASLRFVTVIALILFGYLFLNVFYVVHFVRMYSNALIIEDEAASASDSCLPSRSHAEPESSEPAVRRPEHVRSDL